MSSRSLQILAIVLGVIGVLLGSLGALTAFDAKQSVRSDSELNADVRQAFAAEQARQDRLEKRQASDAEKFVADLSAGKKALVRRIQANTRMNRTQALRIRKLQARIRALSDRDRALSNELAATEADLGGRITRVNRRVNQVYARVNRQENQIARIKGFVSP